MKNRGFYIRKEKDEKINLFINVEQFKQFIEENRNSKEWLKFTIYKNSNKNFGYNIKLNTSEHE
jgi:hypothetical protein